MASSVSLSHDFANDDLCEQECECCANNWNPKNKTTKKEIKRIFMTTEVRKHLINGQLALVVLEGHYELVPKAVAEKIRLRDESVIVVLNEKQDTENEDDLYADYQIPDDLMW